MKKYFSVFVLFVLFTGCETGGKAIFRPMTEEQAVKLKNIIVTDSDRVSGEDLEYITKVQWEW